MSSFSASSICGSHWKIKKGTDVMNAPLLRTFHTELVNLFTNQNINNDKNLQSKMGILHKIVSRKELPENAWLAIKISLSPLIGNDNEDVSAFAKKWMSMIDAMSVDGYPVTQYNDIIHVALTNKINVIVYKNNSALFVRSIVKNKISISAYIDDIFNESDATRTLYQAQESNAYDIVNKIRKHVTQYRLVDAINNLEEEELD